jgi:DegV family protein with EDD domain
MRISTNPGSNLLPKVVEHYDIDLAPQQIVVDGQYHDTRHGVTQRDIDGWIASAKKYPYVLGTAASEFAHIFQELAARDREILSIQTSRKIIQSYDAAMSAKTTLAEHPRFSDVKLEVVDTGNTDCGAGLLTMLAAEARNAGKSLAETAEIVRRAAAQTTMTLWPATLDSLVKGGRASFLRAWLATSVLHVRPLITFIDGELKPATMVKTKNDTAESMRELVQARLPGNKPRIWLGITHGDDIVGARKLAAEMKHHFTVEYTYLVPFASSIYLHVGRGALGAFTIGLDGLPWVPPNPPPSFST